MNVVARIFLVVAILLAVAVAVLRALQDTTDPAIMIGEQIGALIVLLGLPLLVAWLAAGRRKVRHPNRFVLIFCLISGFVALANVPPMLNFEEPEARFARLLREAAGVQPESHRGFGRQRQFDDQVRDQYRKLLQQNRDYTKTMSEMDTSRIRDLNTAAALTNPAVEHEALAQLHASYDVDASQEEKVRVIVADLRHVLEANASSEAERTAMLKGFDESLATQFAKRKESLDAEKAWVDAEDDLHAYAGVHRAAITLLDNHLAISDAVVRNEFNVKIRAQEEKRKAFLDAQHQVKQSQADSLKKMGLSGKDLGAK